MRRREFVSGFGSAVLACPLAARAQAVADAPTSSGPASADSGAGLAGAVEQLRALLASAPGGATPAAEPLRVIQAGIGTAIHMVPIDDVGAGFCFEPVAFFMSGSLACGIPYIQFISSSVLWSRDATSSLGDSHA